METILNWLDKHWLATTVLVMWLILTGGFTKSMHARTDELATEQEEETLLYTIKLFAGVFGCWLVNYHITKVFNDSKNQLETKVVLTYVGLFDTEIIPDKEMKVSTNLLPYFTAVQIAKMERIIYLEHNKPYDSTKLIN